MPKNTDKLSETDNVISEVKSAANKIRKVVC